MKARELRIGNYYNFSKIGNDDVGQITAKDILELEQDPIHDIYYEVPLTEDWLKRFGFEKFVSIYKLKIDAIGIFAISLIDYSFGLYFSESSFRNGSSYTNDNRIKYVHQLQNLYFALTGQELKLKEDEN